MQDESEFLSPIPIILFVIMVILIIYKINSPETGSPKQPNMYQENNTTSESNRLLLKPENLAGFEMPSAQGFIF